MTVQLSDVRPLTPITQEYAYFQSSGFSPKMASDLPPTFVPPVMLVRQARGQGRQA